MDQDDLPPQPEEREEKSFGSSLGQSMGGVVWIVLLFAIVGIVAYAARWLG